MNVMRRRLLGAVVGLGAAAWGAVARADDAKGLPKLETAVAFPKLTFDRPVARAYPADGNHRLYVAEQHTSKIWSFADGHDASEKRLLIELKNPMNRGNEEGLLGLAFHPRFKENRYFYVYYSANDDGTPRSVVSRFTAKEDDASQADPATEKRIWISDKDPFGNHNGGTIAFGPDGYLYITLGDGGAADDPLSTGQNPKDWFGSILRIDVDKVEKDLAYGIPKDNPAKRSKAHAHWAPEVYAIGFRNVWKFSFDRETGALWAADVGQNLYEMVHHVENGGNYGWSIREGFHAFQPQRRQRPDRAGKVKPPIVEYPHVPSTERPDSGLSITGGYVYRGKKLPGLVGVYVYGDFETGRIWGLRYKDGKVLASGELIDVSKSKKLNIASFGEDAAGELFILAFDGKIHELVPRSGGVAAVDRVRE
jgi:glucose/arabinose dehydrogenase